MKEITRRSAAVRWWDPRNAGWWLLIVFTLVGGWVMVSSLAPAFQRYAITGALALVLGTPMFIVVWWLVASMHIVTKPAPSAKIAAVIWGAAVATGLFAINANGAIILMLAQHVSVDFANDWGAAIAAPLTEETGKLLGVAAVVIAARSWLRGPMDGLLLGALVGLGFLTAENVLYAFNVTVMSFGESQPISTIAIYVIRTGLFWPISHAIFTALAGAGLGFLFGRPAARRYGWGILSLALAYGIHFFWNSPILPGMLTRMAFAAVVPFVLWLVVHLARRAESGWVNGVLAGEVERGTIPAEWVQWLGGSLHARRRRRRDLVRQYGPAIRQAERTHEALLVDLADAVDAGDEDAANAYRAQVRSSLEEAQRRAEAAAQAAAAQQQAWADYYRQVEEYRRYWAERGYRV
ncbi:PrsW family glutamic-type intramembrane protease [Demequina sp.]|uniref:PrsW family glutamic-type intramembrane protease n=1 Tax=Demequina sp. TaxID=2050685 RepID=UPI003D12A922